MEATITPGPRDRGTEELGPLIAKLPDCPIAGPRLSGNRCPYRAARVEPLVSLS
jgi:hypothetical protein